MKNTTAYLDLQAAARLLHVRFDTALRYVRGNWLRARLVSGRYWIKRSELTRFQHRHHEIRKAAA